MSVTLVHPAKVVGRNEMPFGRGTHVVPSNIVLDRDPGSHGKGIFRESDWGSELPVKMCIENCGQTVTGIGMVTSADRNSLLSNALSNGTIADPIRSQRCCMLPNDIDPCHYYRASA